MSDKLGGAKRKNGHKSDCSCHICENMMKKAKRGPRESHQLKKKLDQKREQSQASSLNISIDIPISGIHISIMPLSQKSNHSVCSIILLI